MATSTLVSRENNIAQLKVDLTAEEVGQVYKQIYKEYAKTLKVPGFRKGHIPANVIKSRVGEEQIDSIAAEQLKEFAMGRALSEQRLTPRQGRTKWTSEPEPKEGSELSYEFSMPVLPEVTLPDYASYQLTVPVLEISSGMKERFRERLAERYTKYHPKEGPAADGDGLQVSLHTTYKDTGEHSPLHVHDMMYVPGKEGNLPGWDEQFLGKSAGDRFDFDYTMPDNFADQRVAGKQLNVEVEVSTVQTVEPAEIDEAFVKEVLRLDSMDQYDDFVTSSLSRERDMQVQQMKIDLAVQKVIDEMQAEITDDMLDAELDGMVKENDRTLREYGSSLDAYLKEKEQELKDYRESLKPGALNRIKSFLLVKALSETQNLEVTQEEFQRYLLSLMHSENLQQSDLQELLRRQEFINDVHYQIIRHKAFQHVADTAHFNEEVQAEDTDAGAVLGNLPEENEEPHAED